MTEPFDPLQGLHLPKNINLNTPSTWAVRQVLSAQLDNLISSGPADNNKACIRLLRITAFVEKLDKEFPK